MTGTTEPRPLTSVGLVRQLAAASPSRVATFHRNLTGNWVPTTWEALWTEVQLAAAALRRLGLEPGERLAIMSHTCREWQIAELGAALAGAAVVGVDAHGSAAQAAFVLERADAVALVADTQATLEKLGPETLQHFKFVLLFEPAQRPIAAPAWAEALASVEGDRSPTAPDPTPDDPAVVIFTSGTTGEPKGIEYSHRQVMTACWAMVDAYAAIAGRLVCWLPMSALFQRMMNLVGFGNGSITYFVEDPREIVSLLPQIRPTALTSVPRFYEKVHDGIRDQLDRQRGPAKALASAALRVGNRWSRARRAGERPGLWLRVQHTALDALVLRKIRAALGGEIKGLVSGSAALPVWLIDFFFSLGLPLLEAYGVTENPLPVAGNRPEVFRVGSVGKPFVGNDVRISDEGEVLVKGPTMFQGYAGEAPASNRFTADGYYRTGDYGHFDPDGYLYLTGRVSDIIKTSTGRRIGPVRIEAIYGQSRYIDQIVVVGHNRLHLAALIFPNWPAVEAALAASGAETAPDLIRRDLDLLGSSLASYELVRTFAFLPEPLSIEKGELTATLKLRRNHIEALHREVIDRMYARHVAQAAVS